MYNYFCNGNELIYIYHYMIKLVLNSFLKLFVMYIIVLGVKIMNYFEIKNAYGFCHLNIFIS